MQVKLLIASVSLLIIQLFLTTAQSHQQDNPLKEGTIKGQLKVVIDESNTYNGYKAIKESSLQLLRNNINDTLQQHRNLIQGQAQSLAEKNTIIDSLQSRLKNTQINLEETIRTKNSLSFLGIQMDKPYYNSIMWIIIFALGALLTITVFMFRRTNAITQKTKKDLAEIKKEYDDYRNQTRIKKEKMVVDHYNELKKLKEALMKKKGGGGL